MKKGGCPKTAAFFMENDADSMQNHELPNKASFRGFALEEIAAIVQSAEVKLPTSLHLPFKFGQQPSHAIHHLQIPMGHRQLGQIQLDQTCTW